MTLFENRIKNDYFEWLYDYVCRGRAHEKTSYMKLFKHLYRIEFVSIIPNDINRAKDGCDLRYRFGMEYDEQNINDILDILDRPCSVLEMIIALAIKCEETIMDDPRYGDRTIQWFWNMMYNLGICHMTDDFYDEDLVEDVLDKFLYREYEPNGKGGLFYIKNCEEDMRDLNIWSQLCYYLNNFY